MVRHYQDDPDSPPFIKALAEVRRLATREGWCFQHVQAITVAIDQYAAKAFGNREYFLNKPYSIGGGGKITPPDWFGIPKKWARIPAVALQARRAFSFMSLRCVEAYCHAGVH